MDLGIGIVILPDLSWPDALARWRAAEQIGFETAWTYDHLSWRSLRDGPWLGAIPVLGAVAAATSKLRVGTLVTSPNYRHPALLAKDVMTLDQVSAGRISLGIGAGGSGFDANVLGNPPLSPGDRAARFAEFVEAMDQLLREPATSFAGRFYEVVESRTLPGCAQAPRVPFTIGAAGPKAMAVAARHGQTWVTFGPLEADVARPEWYSAVRNQVRSFEQICEGVGRDPGQVRRMALVNLDLRWAQESVAAWDDFCGHIGDLGFTDVTAHWPRTNDSELPGLAAEVFDEICSRIGQR